MSSEKQLCVIPESRKIQPSDSRVSDPREKNEIMQNLMRATRTPASVREFRFPAGQPVSVQRENLKSIRNDDYLVSLKSDGIRYFLFLTMCRGTPIAVMIDRALNIFEIEVWANESFFANDTLFDGELVWEHRGQSPTLLYLVFDVIMIRGNYCADMSYSDRLMMIHKYILPVAPAGVSKDDEQLEQYIIDEDKVFSMNNYHSLKFASKKVLKAENVECIWSERTSVAHMNDGLIFTKNNDSALKSKSTSYSTFKWKQDNTIDVLMSVDESDNYEMKLRDETSIVVVDKLKYGSRVYEVKVVPNRLIQCIVESEMRTSNVSKCVEFVAECTIYIDNNTSVINFFPIKRREDKTSPNNMTVARATIKNVVDNITFDEIVKFMSDSDCKEPLCDNGDTEDGKSGVDKCADSEEAAAVAPVEKQESDQVQETFLMKFLSADEQEVHQRRQKQSG